MNTDPLATDSRVGRRCHFAGRGCHFVGRGCHFVGRGFSPGNEQGSALVLALTATAVVLALASALTLIAVSESAVSASFVRGSEAAYLAEAAAARATAELDAVADWSAVLTGVASSSLRDGAAEGVHLADGVIVDLSAQTTALNRIAASGPFGANNPTWRLFLWGPAEWVAGAGVRTRRCPAYGRGRSSPQTAAFDAHAGVAPGAIMHAIAGVEAHPRASLSRRSRGGGLQ